MDSFFGIGLPELFMIALIALIVLGPERLPATLREVAKFIKGVRSIINELTSQFGDEFKALEDLNPQKLLRELTDDPDKAADAVAKTLGTTTAAKPAATTTPPPAAASPKSPATPSTTSATPVPATPKSETLAATSTATSTTPPASAGAMTAETPAEVKSAVESPVASDEEPRILPPAEPINAVVTSQATTPTIEVNEAEAVVASPMIDMIEGDGPVVEEEPDTSKTMASPAEGLADSAIDILPEHSTLENPATESSGDDIENVDSVAVEAISVESSVDSVQSVDAASIEDTNAGSVDAASNDTNGSDKPTGEVTAFPTRPYSQGATVNGAHVNGNSKENNEA
jgi:sec-independent protein translocase protein TatB